jgi:hypothetical protein
MQTKTPKQKSCAVALPKERNRATFINLCVLKYKKMSITVPLCLTRNTRAKAQRDGAKAILRRGKYAQL